jgi:hypothetical protein
MAGLYRRRLLRLVFFKRFHRGRRSRCRLSGMCKLMRFVAGKRAAASHGSLSFCFSFSRVPVREQGSHVLWRGACWTLVL